MPEIIRPKEWVEIDFSPGPPGPEGENSEAPAFFRNKGKPKGFTRFSKLGGRSGARRD